MHLMLGMPWSILGDPGPPRHPRQYEHSVMLKAIVYMYIHNYAHICYEIIYKYQSVIVLHFVHNHSSQNGIRPCLLTDK